MRSLVSFESKECIRYYEALEVDPVWEVSPFKVGGGGGGWVVE